MRSHGIPALRFQVLVDWSERPNKCTILPLAEAPAHPAVDVVRLSRRGAALPPLAGALLLHPDGVPLGKETLAPGTAGLVSAIDCTWKRLPPILARLGKPLPKLVRVPDGFLTAYPRRNKDDLDPSAGLATIEALYIAGRLLGARDDTLLGKYHFGSRFLELNEPVFARFPS